MTNNSNKIYYSHNIDKSNNNTASQSNSNNNGGQDHRVYVAQPYLISNETVNSYLKVIRPVFILFIILFIIVLVFIVSIISWTLNNIHDNINKHI